VWTIVLRRLPDAMSPALRSTVAWSLADAIEMPSSRASCDVGRSATRGGENGGPGAPHQRLQRAAASPGGCDVNRGGVDQVELAARRVEDGRTGWKYVGTSRRPWPRRWKMRLVDARQGQHRLVQTARG